MNVKQVRCRSPKQEIGKLKLKLKPLVKLSKTMWVSGVVILNKGETTGATHIETKYRVLASVAPSLCMIDYRDKYHVLLWKVSMNL